MKLIRPIWAITVLVSLITGSEIIPAQTKSSSGRNLASTVAENSSPPWEGIKVHGHWTIVIRNRDGSVSSRREFENKLVAAGPKFLSMLLAGQVSQFAWAVTIGTLCGKTVATNCALVESSLANDPIAQNFFKEGLTPVLSVSVPTAGTNSGTLVLSGSTTATYAGQIVTVSTMAVNPGSQADNIYGFTSTNLSPPMNVQAGQTINVTVVISFS